MMMTHAVASTLPLPDDALPFVSKDALAADGTRFFIQTATWREDAKFRDKPQPQWFFRCTAADDGVTRDDYLRRPLKRGEEFILGFSNNRARQAIAQQVEASTPSPLGPYALTKFETENGPMGFAWVISRASTDGLGDTNTLFPDLSRMVAPPSVPRQIAAPKSVRDDPVAALETEDDDLPF